MSFESPAEANQGALGVSPWIAVPPLPNIVAAWAAILPLVIHLADQRDDYVVSGKMALTAKLPLGPFPRLGTFSAYSRLMSRGTDFVDFASTRGGSSRTVWDVSWGSTFPAANGAASSAVLECLLLRPGQKLRRMPEELGRKAEPLDHRSDASTGRRRIQTLHVFQFHRNKGRISLLASVLRIQRFVWYQTIKFLVLSGIAVAMCFIGMYGTAAIILCCAVSGVAAWSASVRRLPGYLGSNEAHDAFMLVAAHVNATEWSLLIGDRGIVDTLLNKPMFVVRQSPLAAGWFWFANIFQLAAMTYVAAEQGWDGVGLMVLLCIQWIHEACFRQTALASTWLREEGIGAEVKSFEFTGRMAMMGAIQLFSGSSVTRWMDDIIVPHPRRDAFLSSIREGERDKQEHHDLLGCPLEIVEATLASTAVLRAEFKTTKPEP